MAGETYRYNIVISASLGTRGVKTGVDAADREMTRMEKRAQKLQSQFERLSKAIDAATAANERASRTGSSRNNGSSRWTDEEKAIKKASSLFDKYDNQVAKLKGYDGEVRRLNKALSQEGVGKHIDDTTKALLREKAAIVDNLKESQKLQKAQEKATRERAAASRRRIGNVQSLGSGFQNAGVGLSVGVTAPFIAGFSKAIEIGSQYEQSMNMFAAVTNATADEMKKADELALQLGNDLTLPGISAKDAAEAMTELGKAGMTASEAMAATKGTLQLATAAGIDAAKAAEITANALNMFNLQANEAGRVSDLLAGAANASSAEITDIAQSLQQAGSVFANAKVPIEDVVALIAELANQGIKGSDAGTSLKTMMQRLQSPTDNAAAALKALNVQVYDQTGAMKPMRDIIGQFEKSLKGLSQQQKDQALNTIFGSDAVRAATIIFGQGAAGFDKMKEAVMRANAAQDLAAARTKGLAGSWEALKSQLETFGLIVYNRIKKPLTELVVIVATVFSRITDAFTSLPEGLQAAILAFGALLSAVGPILAVLGTLTVALGSVASGLVAITSAATVGAALTALAPIVAGLILVLAGLAAGVSAAVAAVWSLGEAWENGFGPIASIVLVGVGAIMAAISPIIGIPVLIAGVLTTLHKIWQTNFAGLRDVAINIWNGIVEATNTAMAALVDLANMVGGRFIAWWRQNYPMIRAIVETVNNAIQNAIQTVLNWIAAFWQAHGSKIIAVVGYIWDKIKSFVMFGVNTVLDIVTTVLQLLNGRWEDSWNSILTLTRRAVGFIVGAMHSFGKLLIDIVTRIGSWLYNNAGAILTKIGSLVATGLKYLIGIISMLPVILLRLVPKFIAAGMSLGSAIWQGIKDGLTGSGDSPAVDAFDLNSIIPEFTPAAPTAIDTLTNGMDKFRESVKGTTGELDKHNKALGDLGDKSERATKAQEKLTLSDANFEEILAAMRSGTKAQESGGRINARNRRTGALGHFQVMPDNVAEWTANTPGVGKMGVDEFRKDARAQVLVFNKYMGSYLRTAMVMANGNKAQAVRMAAAAWYGGPDDFGSYDNGRRFRENEPSFREYTTSVLGRTRRALSKTKGGGFDLKDEDKTLEQLADENLFNDAKQRVQALIQLSRELNVALVVPTKVSTTNDALAIQQKAELKNLQDLKSKREEIEQTVERLGLKQEEYARADIQQAAASIEKLGAVTDAQQFVISTYDESNTKLAQMRDEFNDALTPLESFNKKYEELFKKSGRNREEFDKLNPKLAVTRTLLQGIADTDLANKSAGKIKALGDDISKEVTRLQREAKAAGMTSEQRKAFERENEVNDFLNENKIPAGAIGPGSADYVKWLFKQRDAAQDAADASQKVADATKRYNDEVLSINDSLREHLNLTDTQKLEYELTTGKLKDLTDAQKDNLRQLAGQLEVQKKIDKYNDEVRHLGDSFGQIFADSFTALFEGGVQASLKTLGRGLKNFFFDIIGNIANAIKQKISNAIVEALGIGNGQRTGSSGGGIFGTIISGIKNIFNPSRSSSSAGNSSSASTVGRITDDMSKVVDGLGKTQLGEDVPAFTTNARAVPLGGAARAAESGLPAGAQAMLDANTSFSTGDASAMESGRNGQVLQTAGGALSSLGTMFMSSGPAMAFTFAAQMFMESLQTHSPVMGALKGGLVGMIAGFLNRNRRRKREEKIRSAAILDAFAAIDQLIKDIDNDTITDGKSALSQFDSIRTSYLDQMNQLKDKKTRNHAIADVSRIDERKKNVEAAITRQQNRVTRRSQLTPTFADGGSISGFVSGNYRNNPLGYISGPGTARSDSINAYFPAAGQFAKISNSEYVLDAVTTRNIGVKNLDALRADKGRSFGQASHILKRMRSPIKFADGGAADESSDNGFFLHGGSRGGDIKVEVRNTIIEGPNGGVSTEVYLTTPQGKRKIEGIIAETVYENGRDGKIPKAIRDVHK